MLSDEKIDRLRALRAKGCDPRELAHLFDLSLSYVYQLTTGCYRNHRGKRGRMSAGELRNEAQVPDGPTC